MVHFVLDAVEALDLRQVRVNSRGTGSEQYPPRMMLALLIYAYANGTFSSRQIEGMTYSQVSVRYLCANTHPDHDTICTFRRQNKALLEEAFAKVLELAQEMKLLKVGTVAIDGTKVKANASKHSAVSYGRAGELTEQLRLEVASLVAKAEAADSVPLEDGLSIPAEIARREDRMARMAAARAAIAERERQRKSEEQAEYEAKKAERAARREKGQRVGGREPQAPAPEPEAKAQINFTDAQSRIMKVGNGHFEQAYNAQAAVDIETLLVVGQRVSNEVNDKQQLVPTLESIPASLGRPDKVLVDSGFYSEAQVRGVEEQIGCGVSGPARDKQEEPGETAETETAMPSGIVVYAAVGKATHHRSVADLEARPEPEEPPQDATMQDQMRYRLSTKAGKALYRQRKQTVEPVFGIIKSVLGFRQFSLRGLDNVALEWTLVTLAFNIKRLHRMQQAKAAPAGHSRGRARRQNHSANRTAPFWGAPVRRPKLPMLASWVFAGLAAQDWPVLRILSPTGC